MAEVVTTEPRDDGMVRVVEAEPRTPTPQACGALRKPVRKMIWACDGTNLVVLFHGGATVGDVVIRRDLIPYLDDSMFEAVKPEDVRDFTGGDHAHAMLTLPLRAPREVTW